MKRREFIRLGAATGTVAMANAWCWAGAGQISARTMRLDSHIHILRGGKKLDDLEKYLKTEQITHPVTIFETNDLHFISPVKKICPQAIPFQWPPNPVAPFVDPDPNSLVLGYKIHLRQPARTNPKGQPLAADDESLDPMCAEAEKVGRPFLFHTDADNPKTCTLPQLARLAQRHVGTSFIAAHTGFYTQEYQGDPMKPAQWQAIAPGILQQNIELLLDVKNLYADTVLLGRDYPERSTDPEFKLKLLTREVRRMTPAKKKAFVSKLFIGTDFPWFHKWGESRGGYRFQVECMTRIFGDAFDETETTKRFLALLPHTDTTVTKS